MSRETDDEIQYPLSIVEFDEYLRSVQSTLDSEVNKDESVDDHNNKVVILEDQGVDEEAVDDEVLKAVEKYISDIVLMKRVHFNQNEISEMLDSFSRRLCQMVLTCSSQQDYVKEFIPILKSISELIDSNHTFAIDLGKHEAMQTVFRALLVQHRVNPLVVYQCSEIISRLLKIDSVNNDMDMNTISAIIHNLVLCSNTIRKNNESEHILVRVMSMHLMSINYLCKTRRIQTLAKVYLQEFSIIPETLVSMLSRLNNPNIRIKSLQILDAFLLPEFTDLYKQSRVAEHSVKLLGCSTPDIIYLSGKLLLRVLSVCDLETDTVNKLLKHAVVTLFCKNIICTHDMAGTEENFMKISSETLCMLINEFEYAKKVFTTLLKSLYRREEQVQLSDPLKDMTTIRKAVRDDQTAYKNIASIYYSQIMD